ncbi:SGNH/GDSL hydrolase family protein [Paraburkholderia phytofirmans]|uniref:SGNH/GDSL hydrolase family protein n=1 Tax=Paraburkholderia phytofirmans TaxID=261302 RepID=UPI0038BD11DA
MNRFKYITAWTVGMVLVCATMVTACGGGGGDSQQAASSSKSPVSVSVPASSPTKAPAKQIIIDAEGDSTFYGTQVINGVLSRTPNNTPALLQKMFGQSVTVENNAAGGATLLDALNGAPPRYSLPLASRLASASPKLVLSNFVINDSTAESEGDFRNGLVAWISTVKGMGAVPVLEEPNPVCDGMHPNLGAYVDVLRNVAKAQNVILIQQYDAIKSMVGWESMLTDCVHPTDQLYEVKARREYDVLAPIVASLM